MAVLELIDGGDGNDISIEGASIYANKKKNAMVLEAEIFKSCYFGKYQLLKGHSLYATAIGAAFIFSEIYRDKNCMVIICLDLFLYLNQSECGY